MKESSSIHAQAPVLVDCERMKYPHTGLYYFCLHLGRALVEEAPADQPLQFYVPPTEKGIFGNEAGYLLQRTAHKFRLPATGCLRLWHATHQSTSYFPKRRSLPILLTVHDLNFLYDPSKKAMRVRQYISALQKKVDAAAHVTAISAYTLADLEKHVNLKNTPRSVIYNGCTINPLSHLSTPEGEPGRPFLFTIGTIVEKKNFHVLPCLLAHNDFDLVIAGITQSELYKKRIMAEAAKHGVAHRVRFTGPVSENDKQWYLQHCTAFLFPSLSEGFGLPVVEAMSFGRPLFLSRFTSLPEIGGDASFYFDSFDPDSMRAVLEKGLMKAAEEGWSNQLRQRSSLFSWTESARSYHRLYAGIGS